MRCELSQEARRTQRTERPIEQIRLELNHQDSLLAQMESWVVDNKTFPRQYRISQTVEVIYQISQVFHQWNIKINLTFKALDLDIVQFSSSTGSLKQKKINKHLHAITS